MRSMILAVPLLLGGVCVRAVSFNMEQNGRLYVSENTPGNNRQGSDEEWNCEEKQEDRQGLLRERGCQGERAWACFYTVVRSCTERYSGQTKTIRNRVFSHCGASTKDCW